MTRSHINYFPSFAERFIKTLHASQCQNEATEPITDQRTSSRPKYTAAIRPEDMSRTYWTKVLIDTLVADRIIILRNPCSKVSYIASLCSDLAGPTLRARTQPKGARRTSSLPAIQSSSHVRPQPPCNQIYCRIEFRCVRVHRPLHRGQGIYTHIEWQLRVSHCVDDVIAANHDTSSCYSLWDRM